MEQFDQLESNIKRELEAIGIPLTEAALKSEPTWWENRTQYIIEALWRAVESRYEFTATIRKGGPFRPEEGRIEWLWDAIAWENKPGGGFFRLQLVAESELGRVGKAEEDFERLMVARAEHRMLIFDRPTNAAAEKTIDECMLAARSFASTQKGDRYLFACWIRQPHEHFAFWLRVV